MVMSESEFLHNMNAAQALFPIGAYSSFISGYMKGLKCQFHGEAFATKQEHGRFMTLVNDSDPAKAAFGRGYRAGFTGKKIADILAKMELE
jgi:hypothetical protein